MERILKLTLQGPEWEVESVLRVAAEFTYQVWLEVQQQDEKLRLFDCVVGALVLGRDDAQTRTQFKEVLEKIFINLPQVLPLINERVASYEQMSDDRGQETVTEKSEIAD
jgi:hypothetical protein